MATAGKWSCSDDCVTKCKEWQKKASTKKEEDPKEMNSKASGKLAADCWAPTFEKKYKIKTLNDSSVFPKCQDRAKKTIPLTKAGMTAYIKTCAHVMAKVDKKDCSEDDDKVIELAKELEGLILKAEHGTKATKISKTGGVEKMTDTSQYTGSHQARFDSSGKGKGIEGRTTKVDSSGYVGAYKGSGTYGKK